MRTQGDVSLANEGRGLRRNQACGYLPLGLLVSRIKGKCISVVEAP